MNETMFVSENPITTIEEDFLDRKKYAKNIAQAMTKWNEENSFVVALYGEWGSGKTSIINLALNEIKSEDIKEEKINVIRFNPWMFSETDNLLDAFINELIIAIKKRKMYNKELIKKLQYYSELITLTPRKDHLKTVFNIFISILFLLGITATQINQFILKIPKIWGNILFWGGIFYFLLVALSPVVLKFLSFLQINLNYKEKSINELKEEIIVLLRKKRKKLLIVIDDIDRLTSHEIRQIFRIIRTNADFPNTIYLLAFDRNIIENSLNVQNSISGHDYLEKIVQVNFTLPSISDNKIHGYLSKEIDNFICSLPTSINNYFKDSSYFYLIFHYSFKYFFRNIRDVKRYMNSLRFNIFQLIQKEVIEINPIDFLAIEVLRVFESNYYYFLSKNKSLFTDLKSQFGDEKKVSEERKKSIYESFNIFVSDKNREHLQNLIFELFPQVKSFASIAGVVTGYNSKDWNQELRICSSKIFDSYFNFIPGGDDNEVSIYELNQASIASQDCNSFNQLLDEYKKNGKFENFLEKMFDFSNSEDYFKRENFSNIILALFDSFVNLPISKSFFTLERQDYSIATIIYRLLNRNNNLENNYQLIKIATEKTKSLYGPAFFIYKFGDEIKDEQRGSKIVLDNHLKELEKICVNKIYSNKHNLLDEDNIIFILYRWKEWGENSDEYIQYIQELFMNDELFLKFFDKFEYEIQPLFNYVVKPDKKFHYNNLREFFEIDKVKHKISKIMENKDMYERHKSSIDNFLKIFNAVENDKSSYD
jgi:predicted KAP-like P-loop ATPase